MHACTHHCLNVYTCTIARLTIVWTTAHHSRAGPTCAWQKFRMQTPMESAQSNKILQAESMQYIACMLTSVHFSIMYRSHCLRGSSIMVVIDLGVSSSSQKLRAAYNYVTLCIGVYNSCMHAVTIVLTYTRTIARLNTLINCVNHGSPFKSGLLVLDRNSASNGICTE